jgi:hypothetical protein
MRRTGLFLLAVLALAGAAGWHFRTPLAAWWAARSTAGTPAVPAGPAPRPDPETYAVLAAEIERWRTELAARHRTARSDEERGAVEHDARVLLELMLPSMMRCWLGTPWDFHGTAPRPGGDGIACGYFVSTVLKDAGFRVNRFRLAQQASGNILRSFLHQDDCLLSIGTPYDRFATEMAAADRGVYLVGLDTHVAFIVVADGGFRFIHSSGSRPWCVVDESPLEAEVLRRSNWRMIGHLTGCPQVLRRWLGGETIAVRGA